LKRTGYLLLIYNVISLLERKAEGQPAIGEHEVIDLLPIG